MLLEPLKRLALGYHHRAIRVPSGERVSAAVAKHVGRADSLLDVGCGDGANALRVAAAVGAGRVVGVDVHRRETTHIETHVYDGLHLPFDDQSFEAVSIVDVLHHASDPRQVLREALRVAGRVVVVKDHFRFGPISNALLYGMDIAGNAKDSIPSPGTYLHPSEWVGLIASAGGRLDVLDWPLEIHDMPWRLVVRSELQFSAKILPAR
jgi:SAM-dependent methyltransferase